MHWLESWLLPPECVLTHQPSQDRDIDAKLVAEWPIPTEVCPQCCEPSKDSKICGACLTHPPAFSRTQIGFYFDKELVDLLHGLKYGNKPAYARILAELLAERVDANGIEAIIAVPLYAKRFRDRGFNQAQLIAESLAKILHIPVINQAVFRVKNTPTQTHLNAKQRRQNLKNAFSVDANKFSGLVHVALVDDVMTTGATMQSLAEQIKKKTHIEFIQAWSVAKTK
ncbi:ComF family protein [Thiomicrorhabdus sp.]|uniref:ComF family protein n=1 Tax=Thiomicrorhabdus sp. TaxID=2039724 RepID=UPI002AA8A99E|nr:ComF family protein [Thiomicrorhabdus sp.]